MKDMHKEYKSKIISSISSEEINHFTAFCQHHGLPTNLIDFTYSPLVALFFACYGKTGKDKRAEVYAVNKNRIVDITDILLDIGADNLFELMMYDRDDIRTRILYKIIDCFYEDKENMYYQLISLMKSYNYYNLNIFGVIDKYSDDEEEQSDNEKFNLNYYINQLESSSNYGLFKYGLLMDLYNFLLCNIEDERITHGNMYYEDFDYDEEIMIVAKIFMALLINLLQIYNEEKEHFNINSNLLFTYQPPNIFKRIVNQKGLFVYQSYISYKCPVYDYQYLCTQLINPDVTIEIENYKEILDELDHLGVNIESIYGDYDNIAKYIKNKYDKKLI